MNYNIVFHVDSPSPDILALALSNAQNYKAALPNENFTMVLVVNGPAVTQVTTPSPLLDQFAPLHQQGLSLRVCNNALNKFNISPAQLWPNAQVIPAGVVEIAELQQQGYSYVKP